MARDFFESEGMVHLGSAYGDGRTLCGLALEGDHELEPVSASDRRVVTCSECARIIKHCKGVQVEAW